MLTQDNPSVRAAERYFQTLHPKLGVRERIELRLKAPGDNSPMRQVFVPTSREAARLAVRLGETHNVYAGVTTRLGEDGTKRGACRTSAIWADLDAKGDHTRESRLRQLRVLPYHPSILVRTGGGWHLYWLLSRPAQGPEGLNLAESVMRQIAASLDSDPVHDRSRILRVPGTFNHKYGEPRPVEVEHYEPDRRYDLAELQEMAESLPGKSDNGHATGKVPHEVLGEPIRQHRRNVSLTSIAGSLRDRGSTSRPSGSSCSR